MLLFCLSATSTTTQRSDAVTKKFVGAWRLFATEGNPPDRPGQYGENPNGLLIFDQSGRMALQIATRDDRKPLPPPAKATPDEKASAFDSYVAYFGTYTVDANAGTVTYHLEENMIPGRRGVNNVRWFEFQGDDHLLLVPTEDGKGGKLTSRQDAKFHHVWERIK
jgi:hypothetical protein